MTTYLCDTNIWLRAVQSEAAQHAFAINALTALLTRGDEIVLTAQNLIEFWSVASRPIEANGLGWPAATVRHEIDQLLTQFQLLEETPAIFVYWHQLVTKHHIVGRRVHDARLAAVMLAHEVTHLLTFNGNDFRAFDEIVVVAPADVLESQK
ncbi:type II toxin-antitoxin system VapC family toxin [Candidatus Viridilinea mediisalina]|uniref:PIN domain nuclease n=1 Tax=Candidatus Viridilinea mediisalina TaxID=2024553 RepID=A0A2A6RDD4_9CHLR|nr:PIN domain-containing protein [Candidatus Viridilinea mediisalina]PDV98485.1 PIN domain nuclease [Candidatus Viridilinea mediisalina]